MGNNHFQCLKTTHNMQLNGTIFILNRNDYVLTKHTKTSYIAITMCKSSYRIVNKLFIMISNIMDLIFYCLLIF